MLLCIFVFLLSTLSLPAAPFRELITQYSAKLDPRTTEQLLHYQTAFTAGTAPKIADPRIKAIAIVESHEPLVDLTTANCARIRALADTELAAAHQCPEDIDPRGPGYAKMRTSVFTALVRLITELDRLAPAFGYAPNTLEIHLFEGLRDLATQKELFDAKLASLRKEKPQLSFEEAYQETCTWVSPYQNNVPTHSTGAAIDILLWNRATKSYCDMGRFNVGGSGAPTFSDAPEVTDLQKRNRIFLIAAAIRAGLTNYLYEFWHFSVGDRYAAYWTTPAGQVPVARYNSL